MANYPGPLSLLRPAASDSMADGTTYGGPAVIDRLADEMDAIQADLTGTTGQQTKGGQTSLVARLAAIEADIAALEQLPETAGIKHLGDPAWGFDLTGTTASDTAWNSMWGTVVEGDTILVPAGAAIRLDAPKWIDKQGVSLISASPGPKQAKSLGNSAGQLPTARFIAGAAMPHLFCVEGPASDSERAYVTVADLSFDGGNNCRDVFVWNARECLMARCAVTNLQSGTTMLFNGLSTGIRVGQDDDTTATATTVTSTFTSSATLASMFVVTGTRITFATNTRGLTGDYFVRVTGASTFTIHATRADAFANTSPITPTGTGTLTWNKASNGQDVDIDNCRVMGERPDGTFADKSCGVLINGADCSVKNNTKAVKVTIGTWISGATCRYADNHPFNGGEGAIGAPGAPGIQAVGYADLILSGQSAVVANNYFDNPGSANDAGQEAQYSTSSALTQLGQAGAHIVLDADRGSLADSWVRGTIITGNMFNNGNGGTDTNPLIRIKNSTGRVLDVKITNNTVRCDGSQPLNNDNGAAAMATTAGRLRNGQSPDANSVFSFYNAGGSLAQHQLKQYQPIQFLAVPASETNIVVGNSTNGTVYWIRQSTASTTIATQKFTVHPTRGDAIANTNAITPSTGANATGWLAQGARYALLQGMIVADKWVSPSLTNLEVAYNTVRSCWDPRYGPTTGNGSATPFWPYVSLTDPTPSTLVAPHSYRGNRFLVGTNVLNNQSPDTRIFRDSTNAALFALRTADGTAATGATPRVVDSILAVPVEANTTYILDAYIVYSGNTTDDFSMGWSLPAGATITWSPFGAATNISSDAASQVMRATTSTSYTIGAEAVGTLDACSPYGLLTVGNTAGTFAVSTAQNQAIVRAGSWLRLTPAPALMIGQTYA